jgi:hypothetical protein
MFAHVFPSARLKLTLRFDFHGHDAFSSLHKSAKRKCTPRRFWCGLPPHFTLNESYPSSLTLYGKNEGFLGQNSWAQAKQHHRKQQDAP